MIEIDKAEADGIKEMRLKSFLTALDDLAFVKSTNSVTGEVEEYPPATEDMEAVIKINGEFDREDLKNMLDERFV